MRWLPPSNHRMHHGRVLVLSLVSQFGMACGSSSSVFPSDAGDGRDGSSDFLGTPAVNDASASAILPSNIWDLDFDIIDATYSTLLESIVVVSGSPEPAMYIVDPRARRALEIPLPEAPTSVAVAPSGAMAVVGHDGAVSEVDLVGRTIARRCYVGPAIIDVALTDAGNAFASGAFEGVRGTNMASCLDVSPDELVKPYQAKLAVAGTPPMLYAAENDTSAMDVYMYDPSRTPVRSIGHFDNNGGFSDCGELWVGLSGEVLTRCGVVAKDGTVEPRPSLPLNVREIESAALGRDRMLVIPRALFCVPRCEPASTAYFYDEGWNQLGTVDLRLSDGNDVRVGGRFVFARADGTEWYVLAAAELDVTRNKLEVVDP